MIGIQLERGRSFFCLFLPDITAQLTAKIINLLTNSFPGVGLEGQLVKYIYSVVKAEVYPHGQVDRSDIL